MRKNVHGILTSLGCGTVREPGQFREGLILFSSIQEGQ